MSICQCIILYISKKLEQIIDEIKSLISINVNIEFDIQMDENCSSDLLGYELLLYGDEMIRELYIYGSGYAKFR